MKRLFSASPSSTLGLGILALLSIGLVSPMMGQQVPHLEPNYRQAALYSPDYVRQFVYSSRISPNWIGETDEFWYSFKDSTGTHFYRVNPEKATKQPLFDRVKLAALLSEAVHKPIDPAQMTLQRSRLDDEGKVLTFTMEQKQFEFVLESESLSEKKAEASDESENEIRPGMSREQIIEIIRRRGGTRGGRGGFRAGPTGPGSHRVFSPDRKSYVFAKGHDLYYVDVPEELLKEGLEKARKSAKKEESEDDEKSDEDKDDEQDQKDDDQDDDQGDGSPQEEVKEQKGDETVTQVEQKTKQDDTKQDGDDSEKQEEKQEDKEQEKQEEKKQDEQKEVVEDKDSDKKETDKQETEKSVTEKDDKEESKEGDEAKEEDEEEKELPIPELDDSLDDKATRLTKDGEEDYTFARRRGRGGRGGGNNDDENVTDETKSRPSVSWSEDSKTFYVTRSDTRGVEQLWVINSLATPRPTLESYDYPMPGEEHIRTSELYTFSRETKKLIRTEPKWVDESFSDINWGKDGDEIRFLRRDRLLRGVEYCLLDPKTGKTKCLIEERFENANLAPQSVRYLEKTDEIIWWSERTGWAHFYLYDRDGKLKNPITSGEFRASSIVAVDEDNRTLYLRANAREPGENVYLEHLYSVRFDGTGLQLMDPGNAHHVSSLSPTRRYIVDNCSRVDMPPISVLRKANGDKVMDLEAADMSRLAEIGWQAPETFVVKAADGVTDLYGNMWKPFDFDPKKKYPIIAHVYPGPQTEGTRHDFTAVAGEQQLAQVGFIVIQVGHRGGAPTRSKAYAAHGYFNLRDYGLADKKAAIEQLAQRFPYVDIDRVGLYGHSGGGFMTAAAMLQEPYNDFFKVGVSTAGNHDNNIYNNSWSERYHGLKEVVEETQQNQAGRGGSGRGGFGRGGRGGRGGQRQGVQRTNEQQSDDDDDGGDAAYDYFYEYEIRNDEDGLSLDRWNQQAWWDEELRQPLSLGESRQETQEETRQQEETQEGSRTGRRGGRRGGGERTTQEGDSRERGSRGREERQGLEQTKQDEEKKTDEEKTDEVKDGEKSTETDNSKSDKQDEQGDKETTTEKQDEEQKDGEKDDDKEEDEKEETQESTRKTRFEIEVPTNAELAGNLKGNLFLIHGELDNNVHPANTLRLVDALIKANKRFDMLYLPATRHGFGSYQPYVNQRMYEYFAEHLLEDYQSGADIGEKDVFGGVGR